VLSLPGEVVSACHSVTAAQHQLILVSQVSSYISGKFIYLGGKSGARWFISCLGRVYIPWGKSGARWFIPCLWRVYNFIYLGVSSALVGSSRASGEFIYLGVSPALVGSSRASGEFIYLGVSSALVGSSCVSDMVSLMVVS